MGIMKGLIILFFFLAFVLFLCVIDMAINPRKHIVYWDDENRKQEIRNISQEEVYRLVRATERGFYIQKPNNKILNWFWGWVM